MNNDEQFKENLSKSVIIELHEKNVIPPHSLKNLKKLFIENKFFNY